MKYVSETSAAKSISAYVILDKKGKHVATVKAHYAASSRCTVNIHDDKAGFQHASARGYGYDKLTSALSGLTIDGNKLTDHCGQSPKPPKGRKYFPQSYKPRKGYLLANGGSYDTATGNRLDSYHWRDLALEQWRIANGKAVSDWPNDETYSEIQSNARRLAREAEESGRVVWGYGSCYRESGLKYLEAIGYRVIQAI